MMKVSIAVFSVMLVIAPEAGNAATSEEARVDAAQLSSPYEKESKAKTSKEEDSLSIGGLMAALIIIVVGVRFYAPVLRRYGTSIKDHADEIGPIV